MMIRRVKSLSPLLNTRFVVAQQALVRPAPIAIRQFSINTIFKQQEEAQEEIVAKQFITPDFYFKDKRELNKIFIGTMDSIVRSITQEENYVPHNIPEFILGKADLRFKVFTKAMQTFGREIPSRDLPNIITVQHLVNWFVEKVEAEKPKETYRVPDNVKLFIEKHEKVRQRRQNMREAFAAREEKEQRANKKHNSLYGDTDLTRQQVDQIKRKL